LSAQLKIASGAAKPIRTTCDVRGFVVVVPAGRSRRAQVTVESAIDFVAIDQVPRADNQVRRRIKKFAITEEVAARKCAVDES